MNGEEPKITFDLDPDHLPATNWSAFDTMTETERHTAALADPDALPATEAQLARASRALPPLFPYKLYRKSIDQP